MGRAVPYNNRATPGAGGQSDYWVDRACLYLTWVFSYAMCIIHCLRDFLPAFLRKVMRYVRGEELPKAGPEPSTSYTSWRELVPPLMWTVMYYLPAVLIFSTTPWYVFCRLYLVVESFMHLAHVSEETLQVVRWSQYVCDPSRCRYESSRRWFLWGAGGLDQTATHSGKSHLEGWSDMLGLAFRRHCRWCPMACPGSSWQDRSRNQVERCQAVLAVDLKRPSFSGTKPMTADVSALFRLEEQTDAHGC